jgi:hypothetical protein
MTKKTRQAYKQAPWRRQIRSLGYSLLPVIALVVVAALHLIISAQSAEAGLQIMDMHYQEEEILRQIANQRTELAFSTSYKKMLVRAERAGYQIAEADSIHYMTIPGYQGQGAVLLAPPPGMETGGAPLVNEYYQESLWDWFLNTFLTGSNRMESSHG